jgi:hypothetical protein
MVSSAEALKNEASETRGKVTSDPVARADCLMKVRRLLVVIGKWF